MEYIDHIEVNGTSGDIAVNKSGAGAPAESTVGNVGQFYMDTATEKVYKCTSAKNGKYTWKLLEGGEVDAALSSTSTNAVQNKAVKAALDEKAGSATTIAGYGISDAYTKTETDEKMSKASGVKLIENQDSANKKPLRSIDSGTYVLSGYFTPYEGSTESYTFDSGMIVAILKETSKSYVQVFYPKSNVIQYLEITDTAVTRKDAKLVNMESVANRVSSITSSSDATHYPSAKAVYEAIQESGVPLAGSTAPETTTKGVVGQSYFVIVNKAVTEMYVCTSALIGSYTWDKVEFGGTSGTGGLNSTEKNLIISILRNAVYNSDQSSNITSLAAQFGVTESVYYTITYNLTNATSNNTATTAQSGSSFSAIITANEGYTLDSATVIMGDTDITSTAYANGNISITEVTGNVIINVVAQQTGSGGQLVTNGLQAYFDFRSATYNNSGSGGCTTIAPTQGTGQLFTWAANSIATQDENGINLANARVYQYDPAGGTSGTSYNDALTLVMLTKGDVPKKGFTYTNLGSRWGFSPSYKTASGTANAEIKSDFTDSKSGYVFSVYRIDGQSLKEVMNTSSTTYDGSELENFVSWDGTVEIGMQQANKEGNYIVAAAIYNRAITDVEIESISEFMQTLEVTG